jgi:hypothetical protein
MQVTSTIYLNRETNALRGGIKVAGGIKEVSESAVLSVYLSSE